MKAVLFRRGLMRCRRTAILVVSVLPLLLLASFCCVVVADVINTPLCGEMHGFADEFNDHFSIPVETAPAVGEAIILIVHPFSRNIDSLFEHWLYLNATYHLPEGPLVSRMSDNNGLLELRNVAAGTDIEVRVHRVRVDGSVPFRFFSFFANRPVCHISVSPDNSFLAQVPHRLGDSNAKPVSMYFKTVLPPDRNAATISIVADARDGEPYQVLNKDGVWQSHAANDLILPSSGNSIFFSFNPTQADISTAFCFTSVYVSYASVQGGTVAPASGTPAGERGGDAGRSNSTRPPGGAARTTTAAPASISMSLLRRLLIVALCCFVLWQVAHAVYNYHVLGKRDVMEIVPCAEMVTAGARGMQLAAWRGLGLSYRRSDGYDPLQGMSDPYA